MKARRGPAPIDDRAGEIGGWWVVRAPLRDERQALGRRGGGMPLLIVDDRIPDDQVDVIVREANAFVAGDYENAPHIPLAREKLYPPLTVVR